MRESRETLGIEEKSVKEVLENWKGNSRGDVKRKGMPEVGGGKDERVVKGSRTMSRDGKSTRGREPRRTSQGGCKLKQGRQIGRNPAPKQLENKNADEIFTTICDRQPAQTIAIGGDVFVASQVEDEPNAFVNKALQNEVLFSRKVVVHQTAIIKERKDKGGNQNDTKLLGKKIAVEFEAVKGKVYFGRDV